MFCGWHNVVDSVKDKYLKISFKQANSKESEQLYQLDKLSDKKHYWQCNFFGKDVTKLAIINKKIAGFVVYQVTDVVDILRITTHHDFKNQGVATALIKGLKQLNKPIMLELRDSNFKAYQLYQKLGFEQISKREKYYTDGEDAKIMRFLNRDKQ
ncbi:MAG: GNAT family N-acetyltransferase [Gammaproteobacteria bacterium]|nr:GNAT family N-acetyltransferase [Gammaproteobacteria bacterium]